MPSTTPFSQSTANAMQTANNKLQTDYNALLQNPNDQTLFATVRQDVVNYYAVQQTERGYATLAASVAGGTDYNGNIALNNIESYYGDAAFGINEIKVAAGLALQDYRNITNNGSIDPSAGGTVYIPTIADDDIEHQQVFGNLNLPLTYWSGTSLAAYNVNWMGPIANSAELQGLGNQAPLFSSLSQAQVCQSFLNLSDAVSQTNLQTYSQSNPLQTPTTNQEFDQDLGVFSQAAISIANACAGAAGTSLRNTLSSYGVTFSNIMSSMTSFTINNNGTTFSGTTFYNAADGLNITTSEIDAEQSINNSNSLVVQDDAVGNVQESYIGYTAGSSQPTIEAFAQASPTGTPQGSIQINLNPGSSPTTTVADADASGTIGTLNLSGVATVSNAFFNASNTAVANGTGLNILIGGDGSTLTDTNSGGIFFNLGNGGSATTGSNAQVVDFGSTFTINNQGSACTDGIHCDGVTVNGTAETVNVDSGSSATANGNNNAITSGDNASVATIGNNNTITAGADDTLTDTGTYDTYTADFGSILTETTTDSTLFVNGGNLSITGAQGDTIAATGTDDAVTFLDGGTFNLNGVGSSATLNGNDVTAWGNNDQSIAVLGTLDTVTLGADSSADIEGANDVVGADLGGDTLTFGNGFNVAYATGDAIQAAGSSGNLEVFGNSNTVTADSGNTFTFSGTSDLLSGSDLGQIYLGDNSTSLTVDGDNDTANGTAGNVISFSGVNDTVNGDGVTVNASAGTTIDQSGTGDIDTFNGGGTITDTATSGTDTIYGTDVTVNASGVNLVVDTAGATVTVDGSNDTITVAASVSLNFEGSSDTVNFTGTGDAATLLGGSGDIVNNDNSGDSADLSAGTSATVNGDGGVVGLSGSDASVTTSNETINTIAGDQAESVNGTGNAIYEAQNNALNVSGGSNTVEMTAANDYVGILSGGGNVVDNDNSGDTVDVTAETSTTINGSGGIVGFTGSDASVTTSNETINTIAGDQSENVTGTGNTINEAANNALNVSGASNTVEMTAANDYVGILSGTGNVVDNDNSGDTVNMLANTAATVAGSGGVVGLAGSGVSVTANNEAITTTTNDQSENVTGTGDTIYEAASTGINLSGGSDTVDLTSSGDYLGLLGGAGYTVSGTGDTIATWANTSLSLSGGADTVDLGDSSYASLQSGSGYSVNEGAGVWVNMASDTGASINGSGGTVELAGSGVSVATSNATINTIDSDQGETVAGTGNTIYEAANNGFNVSGASNTVDLTAANDYVGILNGGGNVVDNDYSGDTVNMLGNTAATVIGSGGVVGLLGSGIGVTTSNETIATQANDQSETVIGTGDTIYETANNGFALFGGFDTTDLTAANDAVTLESGGGYVVDNDDGGDVANLAANTSATITGTGGAVGFLGSGATADTSNETINTLANDQNEAVNGTGDVLFEAAGNSANVSGGFDTVYLTSGDYLGLLGGSGYSVDGTGDTIDTWGGTSLNLAGGSDSVGLGGNGDYLGLLGGSGYSITGSGDRFATLSNTDFTLTGNHDSVADGAHDASVIDGFDDTSGSNNTDVVDYTGGNYTGDTAGAGTDLTGGGTDLSSGSTPTPDPCDDPEGLVAGSPAYVDIVTQYDLANGLTAQAAVTEAAWNQSMQAIAAAASSAVTPPSAFEGAQWSGPIVTFSFATGTGSEYNPMSGTVQPQYQEAIEQALQTWANVTGLVFQEVPDSRISDIRIGWNDLDTTASGVVGSTSYMTNGASMLSDVEIRLEDPSEDSLLAGASGALTYSGTNTTLYQAALQQIGSALGLGPSSDPGSIMFPELGVNNQTIDATDVANISSLYDPSSGLTATALLAQAMASFGGVSPAAATSIPVPAPGAELTIASALH